jgi:hypothetical protein
MIYSHAVSIEEIPADIRDLYEIHEWKHACAVLKSDFPDQWQDLIEVLRAFRLRRSDVLTPGGGISPISQWFNKAFLDRKWVEHRFDTKITVDGADSFW